MSILSTLRRLIGLAPARVPPVDDAAFRSIIEHSADVICHLIDHKFVYVSPSVTPIFGWDPATLIGTNGMHSIYPPDLPVLTELLARTGNGEHGPIQHQVRVVSGDGSLKWAETSVLSDRDPAGRMRTILVIRDITERKRLEEELAALAMKDGLTGLANRRCFDETLEKTWRQTLRHGGEMALLLLDIDHFKRFNDAYGHQAGDDCLRAVATVLGSYARRPDDLAARYGGEEFALVLGGVGIAAAAGLAEEIRAAVAALAIPHEANPPGHVTISIGAAAAVARIGGSIRMPESLVQAADHALYKAKSGGRNQVETSMLIAPSG